MLLTLQFRNCLTLLLMIYGVEVANCDDGEKGEDKEKEIDEWDTIEPEYDVPRYEIPKGAQTLEFNPSNLNDEDQHSSHMPLELRCDGCRAIAYVIKEKLKAYQKRYKTKEHLLPEMDIVDLLDRVCRNEKEAFNGYGLKEIMGVRRLSGEGLETKDVPGVQHGGGKWPYRLQEMCFEYVEEIGEYKIYKHFLKRKSLENLICRNKKSELGPICPKKKRKKKKKKKKDEQEPKTELEEPTADSVQPPTGEDPPKSKEDPGQDKDTKENSSTSETQRAEEDNKGPAKEDSKRSEEGGNTPGGKSMESKEEGKHSEQESKPVKEEL